MELQRCSPKKRFAASKRATKTDNQFTYEKKPVILFALAVFAFLNQGRAQSFILEPDNYSSGAVLDHALAYVSLTTAGADNLPIPPVPFHVTASYDSFGFPSTGTNVFGHAGVPFWNTDRRLLMTFSAPVSFLSIDFIGGDLFTNDVAQLDVFNSAGVLIDSYVSNPRAPGSVETMFLSRSAGDIARAIAYAGPGNGNFIRLDNLQFTVVPEPSVAMVATLGAAALCVSKWRRRRIG